MGDVDQEALGSQPGSGAGFVRYYWRVRCPGNASNYDPRLIRGGVGAAHPDADAQAPTAQRYGMKIEHDNRITT